MHEPGRRGAEFGLERPDLHGVTAFAGGGIQSGHGRLYVNIGIRLQWIRADGTPGNG